MRLQNENLWINTVFQDVLSYDCPFIPNVIMGEHDEHKYPFEQENSQNLSQATSYKVINSFKLDEKYEDRDNPSLSCDDDQFDGHKWKFDGHKWIPPDNRKEATYNMINDKQIHMIEYIHSIQKYYPITHNHEHIQEQNDTVIRAINNSNRSSTSHKALILQQSDTGANACATNDLQALYDVVYIKPININSAHKSASMSMVAVGRIRLQTTTDDYITPLCYYSPDIDGTIISPTAIVQEFRSKFKGFQKVCDCNTNKGYLCFNTNDPNASEPILPLFSQNNLWYHQTNNECSTINTQPSSEPIQINKLSKAASYELWHQRLCHPGKNIMESIHNHALGVPKLKGNSFWKCPSCMSAKCQKTYHTQPQLHQPNRKWKKATLQDLLFEEDEDQEDELHLPQALPGQHFHCDFGFMRSKSYQQKDEDGKLQTSIDGKRAYLLIIDRATRYMWVYLANSKRPPIQFCKSILNKFKSSTKHRTIRCDQGELASSNDFKRMLQEEQFTLQVTGSNNSKQNGMAERPHRTLAQMVRCILQGAGLGAEYWSYALQHSVHVKNRLPHKSIGKSPYEAFTGQKPNLTSMRIFGSRIVAQSPRSKTGKLDTNNVATGIFVGFTGTDKNVYYIDDKTKRTKIGSWIEFDEAHYSVPAEFAPIAAQTLQRVGYHPTKDSETTPFATTVAFHLKSPTATPPTCSKDHQFYHLPLDVSPMVVPAGATKIIQTGVSVEADKVAYGEIKQLINTTLPTLKILQGNVELNKDKELMIIVHNDSDQELKLTADDAIATLYIPSTIRPTTTVVPYKPAQRKSKRLQSHTNARAAKLEASLQVSIDIPYDLEMTSDPYNNHTYRVININSRSPTLGMKIEQCKIRNMPILKSCMPGLPSAKIPNWRNDLRNSYITRVNGVPVKTKGEIIEQIEVCKLAKLKHVEITFSTMEKQGLHPQHGVPQLYYDQLQLIAQHIFEIQHLDNLQPDLITHLNNHDINKVINKLKQKHNHFTLSQLKKRSDWPEWDASIFKQLDQYHDQSTFDEPGPLPKGANLLSLCWVYLIKLDGNNTKKSRCVCNGSPRFQGTVTLAQTYASALDQTGAKMFWATCAVNNYIVLGADASNAFAEAPPPKAPLYVRIDENYKRWYKQKFPDKPNLPDDYVLRVRKALQGHPESPRLWAQLIDKIIKNLNLQPCTHERCLYFTENYNNTNKRVIFLRQVDDFAIACQDITTAKQVIADINSK